MTRRATTLMGLTAVAVVAAGVLVLYRQRSTSECEGLAAAHRWEAMANVCEETFHRTGDPSAAARALYGLSALGRTADVDRRLAWLEGTRFAPAISYYRAMSASVKGDDDSALRLLTQALASSQVAGLHEYSGLAAHQLATLQWARGQFQLAFSTLDIAIEEAQKSDNDLLKLIVDGQLADLLGEVGDLPSQAKALYSLADRTKHQPWTMAQVRLRQGMVEMERSNTLLARDYFLDALAAAADAGLPLVVRASHINLASLDRSEGDLDGGERHLTAAAAIPGVHGYDDTTWAFARAQLLRDRGDCAGARVTVEAALDAGPVPDWEWQLLTLSGSCAEAQGDVASARRAFTLATEVIDRLRSEVSTEALRSGLLALRREPYEALFELSVRAGDSERALELTEDLLARVFLQKMTTHDSEVPVDLVSAGRAAERRLAALAAVGALGRSATPMTQRLMALGDRDLLGFVVARGSVYRVHVSAGRVAFTRLERLQRVQELINGLVAQPDELGSAEALGAVLWPSEPVARRVIICADGPLANLSFASLRRRGRWVVEDHVVSNAPSLEAATVPSQRPPGTTDGALRILGDPSGDLPAAATEARSLAGRLNVRPLLEAEATTAELMRSCQADLLHFAGHSGLGAEGGWMALSDGKVTAGELLAAGCAPKLVYLASCASAVRGRSHGAGTLAEAFFAAGAAHVVATTRSVEDDVAAAFTREFFVDADFAQPPERLAEVQRKLSKTNPRSTWEPFVVLGP